MNNTKRHGMKKLLGLVLAVMFGSALQLQAALPVPLRVSLDPSSIPGNGTHFTYGEEVLIQVDFDIPIAVANAVAGTSPYLQLSVTPSDDNRAVYAGSFSNMLFFYFHISTPLCCPINQASNYLTTAP